MNRPVLLLLPACAVARGSGPIRIESEIGDVRFSHASHAAIGCASCHPDAEDGQFNARCRSCHTPTSRYPRSSRDAFHDCCIGCHLRMLKSGRQTGPAKLCSQCHELLRSE